MIGLALCATLARLGIGTADIPGIALFGLANTAIGVGVHQGTLYLVRRLRRTERVATSSVP